MFLPAMMIGSALLQSRAAERKRDQQERFNKGQAETTRYSPWTGMQGQLDTSYVPGALEAAAGGAIQGAGMAQGLQGIMNGMSTPTPMADSLSMPSIGQSAVKPMANTGFLGASTDFSAPSMTDQFQMPEMGQGSMMAQNTLYGGKSGWMGMPSY